MIKLQNSKGVTIARCKTPEDAVKQKALLESLLSETVTIVE